MNSPPPPPPPCEHTPHDALTDEPKRDAKNKKTWSKPTIYTMTGIVDTVTGATMQFQENATYNNITS